jgi:hypothetical protein
MPYSADPTKLLPCWLESDAALPIEKRPIFLSLTLTRGDVMAIDDLYEQIAALPQGSRQIYDLTEKILQMGIRDWRNMGAALQEKGLAPNTPFSLDALRKVLMFQEMFELAENYPRQILAGARDLKNFVPPLSSTKGGIMPAPEDPAKTADTTSAASAQ